MSGIEAVCGNCAHWGSRYHGRIPTGPWETCEVALPPWIMDAIETVDGSAHWLDDSNGDFWESPSKKTSKGSTCMFFKEAENVE